MTKPQTCSRSYTRAQKTRELSNYLNFNQYQVGKRNTTTTKSLIFQKKQHQLWNNPKSLKWNTK